MGFEYSPGDREIWFYDSIGPAFNDCIDDAMVRSALKAMNGNDVTLRLNSPGGLVDVGASIYNALAEYKGHVRIIVDGLAASCASWILMAGSERLMAENAMVMIHSPWSTFSGNADSFESEAKVLRRYEDRMVGAYVSRTGQTEEAIRQMLAAETWMGPEESVELGFADGIVAANDVTNKKRSASAARRGMSVAQAKLKVALAKARCAKLLYDV